MKLQIFFSGKSKTKNKPGDLEAQIDDQSSSKSLTILVYGKLPQQALVPGTNDLHQDLCDREHSDLKPLFIVNCDKITISKPWDGYEWPASHGRRTEQQREELLLDRAVTKVREAFTGQDHVYLLVRVPTGDYETVSFAKDVIKTLEWEGPLEANRSLSYTDEAIENPKEAGWYDEDLL